MCMVMIAGKNL